MSDNYTIIQMHDLDDAAAAGGFGDLMEARFAGAALNAETVGVSLQRLKPDARGGFAHRHKQDEEVYVVLDGSGRALVEGDVLELAPWSVLRVSPGALRAFEAGRDGMEFLAFGTHSEDDAEVLEAEWPS
jgi:uncharacterized cupin superfamily protein